MAELEGIGKLRVEEFNDDYLDQFFDILLRVNSPSIPYHHN